MKEYLDGALVSGTGFDSKKMREFSVEVAKELITSAEKRGDWKTSKNEYVVMYVMNKETIKTTSAKYFRDRFSRIDYSAYLFFNFKINLCIVYFQRLSHVFSDLNSRICISWLWSNWN